MKSFFALVLAILGTSLANAWSCNDPGATTKLDLYSLAKIDPKAVCNDGSGAGYYYTQPPVMGSSKTYLIYLAGGGQCWDENSCAARWAGEAYPHHDCDHSSVSKPCFMSSKDFPLTCAKTGIFEADTNKNLPQFAGAHKVYIPYCSSDAHMGDGAMLTRLTGGRAKRFEFRGYRIVQAVIKDLILHRGLDSKSTVIFGGGSAGGRGAMAILDHMPQFLPSGTTLVGFLDSAYYVNVHAAQGSSFKGFAHIMASATLKFVADPLKTCDLQTLQNWQCVFGQYLAPIVKTPFFLVASQYDSWQLSHLINDYDGILKGPTYTASQTLYAEGFAKVTRDGLINLAAPNSIFGPPSSTATVFSPACYGHHESEKPLFWERKDSQGVTMAKAFSSFLSDNHHQFIDDCQTLNCQCSPKSAAHRKANAHDTTTPLPVCSHGNQTLCESSACSAQFTWSNNACIPFKFYHHSGGAAGLLIALLVIVLLVGIGAAVFIVITKLRRKSQYGGGGGEGFLVIGTPV